MTRISEDCCYVQACMALLLTEGVEGVLLLIAVVLLISWLDTPFCVVD